MSGKLSHSESDRALMSKWKKLPTNSKITNSTSTGPVSRSHSLKQLMAVTVTMTPIGLIWIVNTWPLLDPARCFVCRLPAQLLDTVNRQSKRRSTQAHTQGSTNKTGKNLDKLLNAWGRGKAARPDMTTVAQAKDFDRVSDEQVDRWTRCH